MEPRAKSTLTMRTNQDDKVSQVTSTRPKTGCWNTPIVWAENKELRPTATPTQDSAAMQIGPHRRGDR